MGSGVKVGKTSVVIKKILKIWGDWSVGNSKTHKKGGFFNKSGKFDVKTVRQEKLR
jgi:hypothetical protein